MTTTERIPEHLIVDIDVYDQDIAAPVDKFQEVAADLASRGPLVYSTAHDGHWIVTHYKEIQEVLRDAEAFSSYPNNLVTDESFGKFIPLELDPPEHTGYRRALQPLFGPARMKQLREDVRQVVTELIDKFADRGEAEFVAEFAHELPARIFLSLMDWPMEDVSLFSEATNILLFGKPGGTEEESAQARAESGMNMLAYFQKVVDERRATPTDDVTSKLIHTEVELENETRLLTDEELVRMFFLLLIAGLHTVRGSLSWGVVYLANNPAERQRILDDPDVIPEAVEEILRIEAAVIAGRRATKDVEIGGVTVKKGEQLILMLCSANRDEEEFEDPNTFDIFRSPNRHLSFGGGPHRCLGSHLARIELAVAMEELHKRIPDYQLVESNPPLFHASQVRGCVQLPIVFTPEK